MAHERRPIEASPAVGRRIPTRPIEEDSTLVLICSLSGRELLSRHSRVARSSWPSELRRSRATLVAHARRRSTGIGPTEPPMPMGHRRRVRRSRARARTIRARRRVTTTLELGSPSPALSRASRERAAKECADPNRRELGIVRCSSKSKKTVLPSSSTGPMTALPNDRPARNGHAPERRCRLRRARRRACSPRCARSPSSTTSDPRRGRRTNTARRS